MPFTAGVTGLRNFSWPPHGTRLAYTVQTGSLRDIRIATMGEKPVPQLFLNGAASGYGPKFSADGRWPAYIFDESGGTEVYLRQYP